MDQKKIKICIVEDDDEIRNLTKQVVELSGNIKCSDTFENAEMFLQNCDDLDVDFVLMDIGLPGISGTECVRLCNIENKKIDFIMYTMADGGSPMSPQISRLVADSFSQVSSKNINLEKLTRQENEILGDLDQGLNYKEIAKLRFVSPHTVRSHIRNIYEKLHVHTKLEAIRIYQKHN